MRFARPLRYIANKMRKEHGDLTFTEYVEGLILLDAALAESKSVRTRFVNIKRARDVSDEELPKWVLYDFPLGDFRDAIKRMRDERLRARGNSAP